MLAERLGVRYVDDAPAEYSSESLTQQFAALPEELVERLCNAAIQGRAQRLEALAGEVEEFSTAAAASILRLARDFEYDTLVAALRSPHRDAAPVS